MQKYAQYLIIFLAFVASSLTAQTLPCSDDLRQTENLALGAFITQSSYYDHAASPQCGEPRPLSRPTSIEEIHTTVENSPWWQADLKNNVQLNSIQLDFEESDYPNGLQNYYILLSEYPMDQTDLKGLLSAPAVEHIYVSIPLKHKTVLSLGKRTARYIRLQLAEPGQLMFNNLIILGNTQKYEIANNGIDDDCDGFVDCLDADLQPIIHNALASPATCPTCDDGSITLKTGGKELSYSLDGGISFNAITNSEENFSVGVTGGQYNLVVSNAAGCTATYRQNPIAVPSILSPDFSACGNGNFNNGFQTWSGGLGTHTNAGVNFNNNTIDPAGLRHRIIPSNPGANDPLVGANIPLASPSGQAQFARLGNPADFGGRAQRLTYCFQVTQANANFSFSYAAVLMDGHDGNPNAQSFFSWNISTQNGATINTNTLMPGVGGGMVRLMAGSSTFFQPWTCVTVNLTPFIGQMVCAQYISAGCSQTAHGGYAYIDGLCERPIPATINMPGSVCTNLGVINATATGGGDFSSYYWTVELLDDAGNPFRFANSAPGFMMPIQPFNDILPYFLAATGMREIPCGSTFRVTLTIVGRCASNIITTSKTFVTTCVPPIDYCDLTICEGSSLPIQMQGTGTCNTCEFEWSPSNYLNSPELPFPSIINALGKDETYHVTITDPGNRCTTEQTIETWIEPTLNGQLTAHTACVDACHSSIVAEYITNANVDQTFFRVIATSNNPSGSYPFTFTSVTNLPNGYKKYTYTSSPIENKGISNETNINDPIQFVVTLATNPPAGYCRVGTCNNSLTYNLAMPRGIFWGEPAVFIPNIFCLTASDPANRLFNPWFVTNNTKPNVYWMKIQVFDGWGGLIYQNEMDLNPTCNTTQGFAGNETGFPWNGHWNNDINGELLGTDVYTYLITYRNCFGEIKKPGTITFLNDCVSGPLDDDK